jgi:hypothetical protein
VKLRQGGLIWKVKPRLFTLVKCDPLLLRPAREHRIAMAKYLLTKEDRAKGNLVRSEGNHARKLRRLAEMWLLDRLLAEAAMPEWYPER